MHCARLINLFLILVFGLYCFCLPKVINAQSAENFSTESRVTYTVLEDGLTNVSHEFAITNLKPTVYLSQHTLKLSYPSLSGISASTNGATIEPYVVREGSNTSITLNFDDSVVGEGQTRKFIIKYETKDVAQKTGQVLEIRIPALTGATDFAKHSIAVGVPASMGEPVRQKPNPDSVEKKFDQIIFTYNTSPNESISLQFGEVQFFNLKTSYPLNNPSPNQAYGQIAFPPDTSFQKWQYKNIDPLPHRMQIDGDGNWIATYLVPPNSETKVRLEADVKLTLDPIAEVPIIQPLPDHVQEKPYWQISHPTLINKFTNQSAGEIYTTVIESLKYDTQKVLAGDISTRLGAVGALESPDSAVCQEFSDLLVAGWRRAGVPARRLNGYAYTTNQSTRPLSYNGTILHAWVDFFNSEKNYWQMVDPTWQNTTGGVDYFYQFDLNHIVLSIHGISSTEPYPAGSYADSQNQTDLIISLTEPFEFDRPNFSIEIIKKPWLWWSLPGSYQLKITNQTGQAWYNVPIATKTNETTITPDSLKETFLPFETKTFSLTASVPVKKGILNDQLIITIGTPEKITEYETQITAIPAIIASILSLNVSTPLGSIIIISTLTAGSLLVFRRKRKASVRRQSQKITQPAEELPSNQ